MSEDLIKKLQKFELFEAIHANHIQLMLDRGVLRNFTKGEYLTKESEIGEAIYFIIKGRAEVLVSRPDDGGQERIATIKEGNIVGESVLIGKKRRVADVVVKDQLQAYTWDKEDLAKLFDENPKVGYLFMRNIARNVADKLVATNQSLRNILNDIRSDVI